MRDAKMLRRGNLFTIIGLFTMQSFIGSFSFSPHLQDFTSEILFASSEKSRFITLGLRLNNLKSKCGGEGEGGSGKELYFEKQTRKE